MVAAYSTSPTCSTDGGAVCGGATGEVAMARLRAVGASLTLVNDKSPCYAQAHFQTHATTHECTELMWSATNDEKVCMSGRKASSPTRRLKAGLAVHEPCAQSCAIRYKWDSATPNNAHTSGVTCHGTRDEYNATMAAPIATDVS